MIGLVDTHAHLQENEFSADLDSVLARAHAAGVRVMVVPGVDAESSRRALDLAEANQSVFAAAGFHPHEASGWSPEGQQRIEALLQEPRVVAVGEIGLDHFRLLSPAPAQRDALARMLELAERHAKPVIIHCRDAWPDLKPALTSWASRVTPRFAGRPLGVLHYFSASLPDALEYAALGFMIAIHTSVTHARADQTREVAAGLPLESLLLETDSPYGAPQAHRGKRNEPGFLPESARLIAELRGLTQEDVAAATTANAVRLFDLPVQAGSTGAAV